jgi:hypothetical protein
MDERNEIHRHARNAAEAKVYSLDNPYLHQGEKLEVEMWFQLPGNCLTYAFLFVALWSIRQPVSWLALIGIPIGVNIVTGLVNWYLYKRALVFGLYLTIFHSWALWLVTLATASVLAYNGLYLLAGLAVLGQAVLFPVLEVHMLLYAFLAQRYGMHAKYAFFKKYYGHSFPFEAS